MAIARRTKTWSRRMRRQERRKVSWERAGARIMGPSRIRHGHKRVPEKPEPHLCGPWYLLVTNVARNLAFVKWSRTLLHRFNVSEPRTSTHQCWRGTAAEQDQLRGRHATSLTRCRLRDAIVSAARCLGRETPRSQKPSGSLWKQQQASRPRGSTPVDQTRFSRWQDSAKVSRS